MEGSCTMVKSSVKWRTIKILSNLRFEIKIRVVPAREPMKLAHIPNPYTHFIGGIQTWTRDNRWWWARKQIGITKRKRVTFGASILLYGIGGGGWNGSLHSALTGHPTAFLEVRLLTNPPSPSDRESSTRMAVDSSIEALTLSLWCQSVLDKWRLIPVHIECT